MEEAESTLELDGQHFLRVPVFARIRAADVSEVPAEIHTPVQATAEKAVKKLYWQDQANPDLVWCQFILDSEGANKNSDYMPRSVIVKSFETARHKPLDMEHIVIEDKSMIGMNRNNPPVKNTIYGVMTNSALADFDGKLLTPKQITNLKLDDDPYRAQEDRITVVAWAAMYYFLFPKTVAQMVKAIEAGDMKVSMERWLRKWDFMVPSTSDENPFDVITKEVAEKTGIFDKWKQRTSVNGGEILRRTLDYSYGGVASTANPANELSRFIDQSEKLRVKAAASFADPAMKILLARHDEVAASFAVSQSDSERAQLSLEHTRLHRAIAAYVG